VGDLVVRVNGGVTMKRLEFTWLKAVTYRICHVPIGGKTDVTLDGWVAHHVVMQENGSVTFENSADLCPALCGKNASRHQPRELAKDGRRSEAVR